MLHEHVINTLQSGSANTIRVNKLILSDAEKSGFSFIRIDSADLC